MQFTSVIIVKQTIEKVWEFLSNPLNSNKWDKSVARVILPESGFTGEGCIIETVAPSGMRQSFIVTEFKRPIHFKFKLLKSSLFKEADLGFFMEEIDNGTRISHVIDIKLWFRSAFLYPILFFTQKKALSKDMGYLKSALEENFHVGRDHN